MQVFGSHVGQFPVAHDGTALDPYLRVKWDGSAVSACAATDESLGTLGQRVLADETKVNILPKTAPVVKMVAGEAVSAGDQVYGFAGGKVGVTSAGGEIAVGQALTEATADGDVIRVARVVKHVVPANA